MIYDLRNFSIRDDQQFLIDTNVWIDTIGPSAGLSRNDRAPEYAELLQALISSGARIGLDSIILSEFSSVTVKILLKQVSNRQMKLVKRSPEYLMVMQRAEVYIRQLLSLTFPINSNYTSLDIELFITNLKSTLMDPNDVLLTNLCREQQFYFITDDQDVKGADCNVLTVNPWLLGLSTSPG